MVGHRRSVRNVIRGLRSQEASTYTHAGKPLPGARVSAPEVVVSILTPTYNHARYIRRCLESAIAQTDPRWEQIVVDDGSDDGTEAIIRSIQDPRIRYVRRTHRGIMHLAESYNLALEMSRGAFVAVLEGDDFWPADKIERQLPLFDRPEVVLSWGLASVTDEAGELLRTSPRAEIVARVQGRRPGKTIDALLERNFIPACTVMCRRDALIRIGGFQQPGGMPTTDYPTWLEMCRVGWFAFGNEVLGSHRRHPGQVTDRMKTEIDLALDWGTRFVENLPDDEREALGLSIDEARRVERHRHGYLDYEAGRAALQDDDDVRGRALFRRALPNGSGETRLKASIGLGCSYLGIDLERVATVAGPIADRWRSLTGPRGRTTER